MNTLNACVCALAGGIISLAASVKWPSQLHVDPVCLAYTCIRMWIGRQLIDNRMEATHLCLLSTHMPTISLMITIPRMHRACS